MASQNSRRYITKSAFSNTSQHFPTLPDTASTGKHQAERDFPTNRRFRHQKEAANDAAKLVTSGGLPVYYFDGGSNGHHFGDRDWIEAKLRRVRDKAERLNLAAEYSRKFKAAFDAEPIEHRKDGKARFTANNWLLKVTR